MRELRVVMLLIICVGCLVKIGMVLSAYWGLGMAR